MLPACFEPISVDWCFVGAKFEFFPSEVDGTDKFVGYAEDPRRFCMKSIRRRCNY